MIIKLGTLLHFILNTFSNTTYSYCQVNISKLYKRVTARSCRLNQLDDTMTDLQNATLHPVYILWRPVVMPSKPAYKHLNIYRNQLII